MRILTYYKQTEGVDVGGRLSSPDSVITVPTLKV